MFEERKENKIKMQHNNSSDALKQKLGLMSMLAAMSAIPVIGGAENGGKVDFQGSSNGRSGFCAQTFKNRKLKNRKRREIGKETKRRMRNL
jgi:hypothetical protein